MSSGQEEAKGSSSSPSRSDLHSDDGSSAASRFRNLRGVQWRINLGILPSDSSPIEDLRQVAADSRRRYAELRRHLLVDPYVAKNTFEESDLVMDNPLSQNPDSMWGRFFRNAELEKMLDQDLSRLYPEHGNYFQMPACQAMLRQILLLWCLKYPETGYRQGMHELLAPLLYVLHVDVQHLLQVRKLHEDHFNDRFDGMSLMENNWEQKRSSSNGSHLFTKRALWNREGDSLSVSIGKLSSLDDLDPDVRTIILASDAYGAEGELGILLSERFMEHDAYCMFDALMSGSGGVVVMSDLFAASPSIGSPTGLPPVIEASSSLYSLLSIVDSSLHCHLVELGVEPQFFALRWLRVLFGREFLLEDLLIVWDAIFESPNEPLESVEGAHTAFGIAHSYRGAFISTMAVSMLLFLRPSLLGTENATSCLQKLLNFPQKIDVRKLIDKARSLQVLALDTNIMLSPSPSLFERSRSSSGRYHRLSSPLKVPGSPGVMPISPVPESYWEQKWRNSVLQKTDNAKGSIGHPLADHNGPEKSQLNLLRAESDPSPTNSKGGKRGSHGSARRRLLDELVQDVWSKREVEENNPLGVPTVGDAKPTLGVSKNSQGPTQKHGEKKNFDGLCEDACLIGIPASEGNSSPFSASTCSLGRDPDHEIDSEKSSIDTAVTDETEDIRTSNVDEACATSTSQYYQGFVPTEQKGKKTDSHSGDQTNSQPSTVKQPPLSKDRKSASGKFQWFWKFGRNGSDDISDKVCTTEPKRLIKEESSLCQETHGTWTAGGASPSPSTSGTDGADKNLPDTLRNLGQSMLENVQVIESAFQPERSQVASLNLPRNILGSKGQIAALAALKELRKISNLLSEM